LRGLYRFETGRMAIFATTASTPLIHLVHRPGKCLVARHAIDRQQRQHRVAREILRMRAPGILAQGLDLGREQPGIERQRQLGEREWQLHGRHPCRHTRRSGDFTSAPLSAARCEGQ